MIISDLTNEQYHAHHAISSSDVDDSYDDDMLRVTDWETFMQIVKETWND